MEKQKILDQIKGGLIVSCQALEHEPLYTKEGGIMPLMAKAAAQSGAVGIRANTVRDITQIKEVVALPVIGIIKKDYEGEETAFTPGEQEWDYLYSRDAGNAFYLIGEKGKDGSIYCVGSGKAKPLREYIYQIRDAAAPDATPGIGKKAYGTQPVMHLCADISSLKNDTGFEPAYEFSSGIREMIRWMKERDK